MILLRLYQAFRTLLFPVIWGYSKLHPQRRIRYQLEKRLNRRDPSFQADILFEISSEGELEQVLYLIEDCIRDGKKIELLFSSDSVVSKCQELQDRYPQALRVFAIPFLSYFPFFFNRSLREIISAPRIIMCRYDFFPELLETCQHKSLSIIAANGLTLNQNTGLKKYWYHQFYKQVTQVVASTDKDRDEILKMYPHVECVSFDFRSLQIQGRKDLREAKYRRVFPEIERLRAKIGKSKRSLILGSLWAQDIESISSEIWRVAQAGEIYIAILPHNLSSKSLEAISGLIPTHSNIEIITQRGILCELYNEFTHAFIGGGYRGSPGVHSLLEPYIAGCHLYCGVEVSRSSEYRAILESGQSVHILSDSNKLNLKKLKNSEVKDDRSLLDQAQLNHNYFKTKQLLQL